MTDERYAPATCRRERSSGGCLPRCGSTRRSGSCSGARRCRSWAIASRRSRSPSRCSGSARRPTSASSWPPAASRSRSSRWRAACGPTASAGAGSCSPPTSCARSRRRATAALLLTGTAEVWMLAVLAFVYGTAGGASSCPALIGLIPQTVSPARLQEANALLALTRSIASVAGPALAGVLVVVGGLGRGDRRRRGDVRGQRAVPGAHAPRRGAAARGRRATSRSWPACAAGWHEVRSRTWLRGA